MGFRYEDGAFVLTRTPCFTPLYHVDVGETLRLFHVLEMPSDLQFDNVVLCSKTTTNVFHNKVCSCYKA
jgi:hypothetical protein